MHSPAETTTLLITLGAVQLNVQDLGALLAGVVLATVLGEALQRRRLSATGGDVTSCED